MDNTIADSSAAGVPLRDVIALLEQWYPPHRADSWDAVGLVCGDPDDRVRRIVLAVDPLAAVADEVIADEAQLLITHHPLLLKGVHGVPANSPKGKVIHRLVRAGAALYTAHTNADAPEDGVSAAIAEALGLRDVQPLTPSTAEPIDKIVVFVPHTYAAGVRRGLEAAGAGAMGDYDSCSYAVEGEGRFRPLAGANPAIGSVGEVEEVAELRIEAVLPRRLRESVLASVRAAHPYEEPAVDIVELADVADPAHGSGRIGVVEAMSLADFAALVAQTLPDTAHGLRVAGDPQRQIETVALCGGSGDFLLDTARGLGADVYLTSDLRHHPVSELHERPDAPAIVDVAHWAAEWMWLPVVRRKLVEALGSSVEVTISTQNTDPWTFRVDQSSGVER